jgi:hypothetical protein
MSESTDREGPDADYPNADDDTASGKYEASNLLPIPAIPDQTRLAQESTYTVHQPTAAEVYEGRLREIWAATHEGDSPPGPDSGSTEAWDLVRDAALRNTSLIGAAVAERTVGPADTGLAGDSRTVELQVGAAVEQLTPDQTPAFIAGTLARTVERLQQEVGRTEDMTRERIMDIVVRALVPLRGDPRIGVLVPSLLGYLNGDKRPRKVGIYETALLLGQLMTGLDDRRNRLMRIFVYHYTLVGMWHLLQDEGVIFNNTIRQVLSVAAGNAGLNLWQILPERVAEARGAEVVRMLRTILATTIRDGPVPENRAAAILAALGLEYSESRAALTVLDAMGTLGDPWTSEAIDVARIEAASAVTALAANPRSEDATARLYNAAVSLQRVAEPLAAAPLHARMLVFTLGLRWSLDLGDDLLDSLDRFDGLDCAAGFMRALGQYQTEGHVQPQQWQTVLEFALLLSQVPKFVPRDRPALALSARSLTEAAGGIRLSGTSASSGFGMQELFAACVRALDALRPPTASRRPDDPLLDTAALLHDAFEVILDQTSFGLADTVDRLTDMRAEPREEFTSSYQSFTEPRGSPLGTGPPVTAGAASTAEWEALTASMLRDPGSIVTALQQI